MLPSLKFDPMQHDTPGIDLLALDMLAKQAAHIRWGSGFVEVGSWAGLSAQVLFRNLPENQVLYCVDHWKGSPNEPLKAISPEHALLTFCKNVGEWGGRIGRDVIPSVGDSCVWAEIFQTAGMKFKMVFIDGDHSYQQVRKDILAWWPLLETGGILCGHDYDVFEGVNGAVNFSFSGKHARLGATIWAVEKLDKADAESRGYKMSPMDKPSVK